MQNAFNMNVPHEGVRDQVVRKWHVVEIILRDSSKFVVFPPGQTVLDNLRGNKFVVSTCVDAAGRKLTQLDALILTWSMTESCL